MQNSSPCYSNHLVRDLLLDESFQQWVLHPNNTSDLFWKQWLMTNPQRAKIVNEARSILENIKFPLYQLSERDIDELWTRVIKHPER